MTENKLIVNASPHIAAKHSTKSLMLDVIIALIPAALAGVFFFGLYSLLIICISILSCVISEFLFNLIRKKPVTVADLSAVVTGLILGLNLPPAVPVYIPIIGGVFAIIIVKMLFGGIGRNFANPAATARVFLALAYTGVMAGGVFSVPNTSFSGIFSFDSVTAATPLSGGSWTYLKLFLGNVGGSIGETSALAILIGGAYLTIKGVIDFRIPLFYLLTASFMSLLIGGSVNDSLFTLLSGGLMFGAFFMATDYATSPKNKTNRMLYGIGLGFLTVVIREFGRYPEGVSLAIIIMNMLVPIIDKRILPVRYGSSRKEVLRPVLMLVSAIMAVTLLIAIPFTVRKDSGVSGYTVNYVMQSTGREIL